jgi:signal transduction histidine kinase
MLELAPSGDAGANAWRDNEAVSRWRELTDAVRRFAQSTPWPWILAAVLGVISLVEAALYSNPSDRGVAMFVALGATVPLAFADRWPVPAAALITAFVFAMLANTVPTTGAAVVAEVIALCIVASRTRRLISALFAVPFVLNAMFPLGGEDTADIALLLTVVAVAALAIGDARGLRGEAIAERDASRMQVADTMREQAAMEERARIARELHDVVAHHVSMIAVQAEAARLTTPDLPQEGRQRFGDIAQSARDALGEMRRLLGVLREDARGGGERRPQPGLDRLQELIDDARATGTPVRLTLRGPVRPLAPSVDLTAYRIVQEALTNARRHAPGANVEVSLRYGIDALQLSVRDDGQGSPPEWSEGNGLIGMRERATMVGGTLRTGPGERGDFLVKAELPIERASSEVAHEHGEVTG